MNDISQYPIEVATLADLNRMRELEKLCFDRDAWPLIELLAALSLPGLVRLKVDIEGRMAGFIGGDPHRLEGIGWITTVGVRPEYRGMGLGTRLIQACEREMGMPKMRLSVRRLNMSAQRLYAGLGYQHVGVWDGYYDDGEDALIMEKVITSVS